MKMHEKLGCLWVKLGTDLFEIGWRNFLIISDYFSRYPIIEELKSITSAAVVTATMEILSMFCIPREIVSDNRPQYQGITIKFVQNGVYSIQQPIQGTHNQMDS